MNKYSFRYMISGIIVCILSIAFIQCTPSTKDKTAAVEKSAVPLDKVTIESKVDTPAQSTDALAIKEPEVVTTPNTVEPKNNAKTTSTQAAEIKKPVAAIKINEPKANNVKNAPIPVVASVTEKTNAMEITNESKPMKVPIVNKSAVLTSPDFSLKATKAVIIGTSSLHGWESKITQIEGKGSFQAKDNNIVAIKDMEVKMEVKGIKSKEGKKMDNKTYETFNSDKNPFIIYAFHDAQVKIDAANVVTIAASGSLSMAGITKSLPLTAKGHLMKNGDLQLSISQNIKMTAFDMKPPVMLLGTIKVGDDITVAFDITLTPTKPLN